MPPLQTHVIWIVACEAFPTAIRRPDEADHSGINGIMIWVPLLNCYVNTVSNIFMPLIRSNRSSRHTLDHLCVFLPNVVETFSFLRPSRNAGGPRTRDGNPSKNPYPPPQTLVTFHGGRVIDIRVAFSSPSRYLLGTRPISDFLSCLEGKIRRVTGTEDHRYGTLPARARIRTLTSCQWMLLSRSSPAKRCP